ncbi:MAG: tetratricopeptide repeat protein [Kiritimatiellaeota bacterium]|nr:tetratricopeptide repeat protein [Kiritimatiellota bacterium]
MRNTTAVWLRVGMLAAMVAQLPTTGAPQATSSVAQPPVTSAAKPVVPKYFLLTITNAAPVPPLENRFEQSELVAAHEDLQAGRRDAAIARLEKLLRKTPNLLKAWETLGWAYWQAGREREAIALWERWREVDPGLPTPCNLLAQACIAHKELNRALEYYQQSLRLEPTQFDANYGLARLYRWTGDQDRAVEMFRNLLTRDPGRTDVKVELGRALLENDRFEEAAPIWAEMLQLSPTNQVFMLRQAMVLLYTGHAKESQALMGKILAQDPNNLAVYDMQADLAMASDHPEDAAPILRKIIQLSKDPQQRTQTRARLIRLLVRLNRKEPLRYSLDESLVLVRDMVRENPSNIDAQLMQGELLLVELKAEAAEQHFLHVLQTFNTDNLRARRGLFETYLTLRRFTDAEAQYKIIETFNPR